MKTNEPKLLTIKVGKYYKTYGGWKALVIWKADNYILVIHKPKEEGESTVVNHDLKGKSVSILSVNEPPQYTEHHPADLKEIWV